MGRSLARPLDAIENTEPWLFRFLAHETHDSFWENHSVAPEEIDVPILAACGYRDAHTASMVDFVDRIKAPKRMVLSPWRHCLPQQGREAAVDFRYQAVAWFNQYLKDETITMEPHPTVTYWTEREGGWTPEADTWRGTDWWPTASRSPLLEFALTASGLQPTDSFESGAIDRTYEPEHTVGMESLDRVGNAINTGVSPTSPARTLDI